MYIHCGRILKVVLLLRFMVKKFGDHWFKLLVANILSCVSLLCSLSCSPFLLEKPLHSLATLCLKYQEQRSFHFLVDQVYICGYM